MGLVSSSSAESYKQTVKGVDGNGSTGFYTTGEVVSSEEVTVPETAEDYDIENIDFDEMEEDIDLSEIITGEMSDTTLPQGEGKAEESQPVAPPLGTGSIGTETGTVAGDVSSSGLNSSGDVSVPQGSGSEIGGNSANGIDKEAITADEITYELPNNMTIEIDGNEYDPLQLSSEDLEALIGKMNQNEYDALIDNIIDYYQKNIDYYDEMLGNVNDLLDILKDRRTEEFTDAFLLLQFNMNGFLATFIRNYFSKEIFEMDLSDDEYANWTTAQRFDFVLDLLAKREYTGDDFDSLTTEQKLELCRNCEEIDAQWFLEEYQIFIDQKTNLEIYLNKTYGERFDIHSYDDYVRAVDGLLTYKDQLESAIKTTKNMMDSAYYDYLPYLEEYNDFPFDEEEFAIIAFTNGSQELMDLLKASEIFPQFARVYYFLYKTKGSKEANEYLKKCKYEINNVRGQISANEFLSLLLEKDGEGDERLKAIANELGISVKGLVDGLNSFFMGGVYTVEALLTAVGLLPENRTMSVSEYEKMYILQALFSQEEKEALGLIKKDPVTGEWKNAEESIIDYTKEYSGGALLKHTYQIAQGIGNMLPSIAIASVCPLAGSIAMGISAGGNAYHNAMVEGHSLASSIMYGIFTGASESISEYILGGLPFLSNSKVHSLLSYLGAAGKEGFQEIFQGLMDLTYQYAYMGKELPKTEKEWLEVLNDLKWQGIYGALTAGILNVGPLVGSIRRRQAFSTFMKNNNITQEQYENALNDLRASNPDLANAKESELLTYYAQELMRRAVIQQTALTNNVTPKAAEIMLALNVDANVASYMEKTNCTLIEALDVCNVITREFLEAYMKDSNTEVPKGVPQEIIDYLNAIRTNIDKTAPMAMPKAVQEFVKEYQEAESAKELQIFKDTVDGFVSSTIPLLLDGKTSIATILKNPDGTSMEKLALVNAILENVDYTKMRASDIKAIQDYFNNIKAETFEMMIKKAQMEEVIKDVTLHYRAKAYVTLENAMEAFAGQNSDAFPNFRIKVFKKYGLVIRADNLEPNSTYRMVYEYTVIDPDTGSPVKKAQELFIKVNNRGAGFIQELYESNYKDSTFMEHYKDLTVVGLERVGEGFNPSSKANDALSSGETYGVSQSALSNVGYLDGVNPWDDAYEKLIKGKDLTLTERGREIVELVRSYLPGLSDSAIVQYLKKVNSEGACSYADVANQIVIQFADNPGLFKQIFGYDLFITDKEGTKRINAELLLADLYTYENLNNKGLFQDKFLRGKQYVNPLKHEAQNYMSTSSGFNKDAIQAFFNYKLSKAGLSDSVAIDVTTSVITSTYNSTGSTLTSEQIYAEIDRRLSSGIRCSIGVYVNHDKNQGFRMYALNPESGVHDILFSSDMWHQNDVLFEAGLRGKKVSGHTMTITQVSQEGMYVESWGQSFFIPYSELGNTGFTIKDMWIEVNNK